MNDLNIIKSISSSTKRTIKGKATIIETNEGKYVIKKSNKNMENLFNYLLNRNFTNFPSFIHQNKEYNISKYIENTSEPLNQKYEDLIALIASLHNKTSYFKNISIDKYKEIYENIKNNLINEEIEYEKYYKEFFKQIYPSPSMQIFQTSYSKIKKTFYFCHKELEKWYEIIKTKNKIRVVLLHNNLKIEHLIKNKIDYLISWDNYKFDTPILDIYNLYKNEYDKTNFDILLTKYIKLFPLLDHELKLLFILISIPPEINKKQGEFYQSKEIYNIINYINKTEKLIRPYYSKQKEEEK